jgi:hypothetical protein
LLAAQLHYFRYPRAEWRHLLEVAKACGINTIDTVIPWNLHEPQLGVFSFEAEADLPGYLDLCAELGLYAIVRPDPYICAEWENGGFPAWLTAMPDLELRVDHPTYVEYTRRWFDVLLPLLVSRQIDRGGAIILCQIENEHWASGRYGHDAHQQSLANLALEYGMTVPQYTCMGAMDGQAEFRNGWSGIAEKLVQTRQLWPANPMIVSELWSGWFDNWGASRHNHKTAARLDLTLHQLLAVGASGFSHWMWAGGTNFGFWGGRTVGGDTIHMTTSYDYDAPITEYGGLTTKAFVARRHHLFWQTLGMPLATVLADALPGGPKVITPAAVAGRGEAGSAPYRTVKAGPHAPAGWEQFSATFLQNLGQEGQTHQVFVPKPTVHLAVDVEAGTLKPLLNNMPLPGGTLQLDYHTCRLLGFWQIADSDVLVAYGQEGEVGQIQLSSTTSAVWEVSDADGTDLTVNQKALRVGFWIADRPTVVQARCGTRKLLLVLLTQARAERCWPTSTGMIIGPHLVLPGETTDQPLIDRRGMQPFYALNAAGELREINFAPAPAPLTPVVWQTPRSLTFQAHTVAELASPEWQPIERPRALESLGCDLGYGWYRATFNLAQATELNLAVPWLSDRARVLLDGQPCGWLGVHPQGPRWTVPLALGAGEHTLHLLVDNLGRFNYGSNTGERKGLLDTVYLGGVQEDLSAGWTALWQEAVFAGEALANAKPEHVRADQANVDLAHFAYQGASVWLLRAFEVEAGLRYVLQLTGDRNPGALFVNGINVGRFSRHNGGGFIKQDITAQLRPGRNYLALNILGYSGWPWQATLLRFDPAQALQGTWAFAPGVTLGAHVAPRAGLPTFWRTTFAYDPQIHGSGPFKLALPGLSKGQIWLNQRNIGRYWQLGPQEFYKLPSSWLAAENELLIFDEEGTAPTRVSIVRDQLGAVRFAD